VGGDGRYFIAREGANRLPDGEVLFVEVEVVVH
jgi:hypothetical protein